MKKPSRIAAGLGLAAVLFVGCHRAAAPVPLDPQALAGVELALRPSAGLALRVDGTVRGAPAEVVLDVAAPMSQVTAGCFPAGPPRSTTAVKLRELAGALSTHPEVALDGVEVGGRRLGTLRTALRTEPGGCVVVLGLEVLSAYVIDVDPVRRRVSLSKARAERPGMESFRIPLARDPQTDRLLLAVKLVQWGRELPVPLVLGSAQAPSLLAERDATRGGFEVDAALAGRVSSGEFRGKLPALNTVTLDAVELAPGVRVTDDTWPLDPRWSHPGAAGVLGPRVWGRYYATLDLPGQELVLARPRVAAQGGMTCDVGGVISEESCYALHVEPQKEGGLTVTTTAWRELRAGGRLHLELLGPDGQPSHGLCQVGVSFDPAGRGVGTSQRLPWKGLEDAMPACAEELKRAGSARFGLFEEGALPQCPGECVYVRDARSRRTLCQCDELVGAGRGEYVLQLLRRSRRAQGTPPETKPAVKSEPEPQDPR